MTAILAHLTFNLAGKIVKKKLDGRTHWVVPTVIITEGVHEGSAGPLLYEADEIAKTATIWNGRPATVYHPELDGKNVSAASPEILEKQTIGIMFNGKYDPKKKKQRVETWIDEEKADRIDKRILNALRKGETLEVSTGVFVDKVECEGVWNGEKYVGKATNFRADHLAILPDRVGACSIKDGAGLFQLNEQAVDNTLGTLLSAGEKVGVELVGNELSFSGITRQLCDLLAASYGEPGKSWMGYLVEVFPDRCIFRTSYSSADSMLEQGYKVGKDDEVTLSGKAVEVVQTVSYTANSKPVTEEKSVTKKELIDSMISNKAFLEADREMLDGRTVADLERYAKLLTPAPVANAIPAPAPTPAPAVEKPLTEVEWLAKAPAGIRQVVANSMAKEAAEKSALTAKILAAPGCLFNADMLAPLTTNDLSAIASLIQEPAPVANGLAGIGQTSYFGQNTLPPAVVANEGKKVAGMEGPKEVAIDWSKGIVS
jgi:hypothetical protein